MYLPIVYCIKRRNGWKAREKSHTVGYEVWPDWLEHTVVFFSQWKNSKHIFQRKSLISRLKVALHLQSMQKRPVNRYFTFRLICLYIYLYKKKTILFLES